MARQLGFARVPPLVTRHVSRDEHLLTDYSCTEKSCWLWPVRGGWRARFAERARARGGEAGTAEGYARRNGTGMWERVSTTVLRQGSHSSWQSADPFHGRTGVRLGVHVAAPGLPSAALPSPWHTAASPRLALVAADPVSQRSEPSSCGWRVISFVGAWMWRA